jgi:hypothetical protein
VERISQTEKKDRAWNAMRTLSKKIVADSPREGKLVEIFKGKHKGKVGVVFWHGRDKFSTSQYQTSIQSAMSESKGTFGFRIGVKTSGGEKFFTKAEYTIK